MSNPDSVGDSHCEYQWPKWDGEIPSRDTSGKLLKLNITGNRCRHRRGHRSRCGHRDRYSLFHSNSETLEDASSTINLSYGSGR